MRDVRGGSDGMKFAPASEPNDSLPGMAAGDREHEPGARVRRIRADIIAFSQRLPDFEQ
jgi:hypothetical protein